MQINCLRHAKLLKCEIVVQMQSKCEGGSKMKNSCCDEIMSLLFDCKPIAKQKIIATTFVNRSKIQKSYCDEPVNNFFKDK